MHRNGLKSNAHETSAKAFDMLRANGISPDAILTTQQNASLKRREDTSAGESQNTVLQELNRRQSFSGIPPNSKALDFDFEALDFDFEDEWAPSTYMNNGFQASERNQDPPVRCHSCKHTKSLQWRKGPDGDRTLCDGCGLRMFLQPTSTCVQQNSNNFYGIRI
jgi:hypothetical protein